MSEFIGLTQQQVEAIEEAAEKISNVESDAYKDAKEFAENLPPELLELQASFEEKLVARTGMSSEELQNLRHDPQQAALLMQDILSDPELRADAEKMAMAMSNYQLKKLMKESPRGEFSIGEASPIMPDGVEINVSPVAVEIPEKNLLDPQKDTQELPFHIEVNTEPGSPERAEAIRLHECMQDGEFKGLCEGVMLDDRGVSQNDVQLASVPQDISIAALTKGRE